MSSEAAALEEMCCANCGIAAIDDVKLLKDCDDGCDLVKYCSDKCKTNHREQHEEECKKRKAEIRDKDLFEQPDESHLGECPICCLPIPLDETKSIFMDCCSQRICNGCDIANQMREFAAGLEQRCPFCREPAPESKKEWDKNRMKRIKKNCPAAMRVMGNERYGEGEYETALKYYTKAAELGDSVAHYNLSVMYREGEGVQKDTEKEMYHVEEAAMKGHPSARYNLGIEEENNNRFERAKKHYIIAANLGLHDSLKSLRTLYADGHASKEDYADALRAYQAAVNATKSVDREKAEAFLRNNS